jgi:hypothetical protein
MQVDDIDVGFPVVRQLAALSRAEKRGVPQPNAIFGKALAEYIANLAIAAIIDHDAGNPAAALIDI